MQLRTWNEVARFIEPMLQLAAILPWRSSRLKMVNMTFYSTSVPNKYQTTSTILLKSQTDHCHQHTQRMTMRHLTQPQTYRHHCLHLSQKKPHRTGSRTHPQSVHHHCSPLLSHCPNPQDQQTQMEARCSPWHALPPSHLQDQTPRQLQWDLNVDWLHSV